MDHPSHRRAAFTLVELLVVVTVIIVLLGLLMPAINAAVEHANFTLCQSNTHQLSYSSYAYMSDYGGSIPDSFTWISHPTYGLHGWHNAGSLTSGLLWGYLPNADFYLCRSFTASYVHGQTSFQCGDSLGVNPAFSYSMNSYLGWTGWNSKPGVTKLSMIKKPGQCLFFGEEDGWVQGGVNAGWSINNASLGWGNPCDCVATYHYPPGGDFAMGCSNAVFVDGHCEKVWNYNNTAMLYSSLW